MKIRIEHIGDSITAPITRENLLYANKAGISHYKHSGRCVEDVITELHGKTVWSQMDELYLNEMTNLKLGRNDPKAPERVVAYFPVDEASAFDTPCHYLLTSSRMVLLLDRVGMNHGCLMSSKPSMAAMRPEIFSVPIASIRSYSVTLSEGRRGSSVLAITFQLTGMRKFTIELGPVDEYVKESDEIEEALSRLMQTHLNKNAGPQRNSVCSSSYRRLASTTSRLRFDSTASMNSSLASSSGSKSGASDHDKSFGTQNSMTSNKSHHHSGKDDSKAGDRVLRHPVFAMLHQWLNAIALTRSRLTVCIFIFSLVSVLTRNTYI